MLTTAMAMMVLQLPPATAVIVEQYATEYNVPYKLAVTVIHAESNARNTAYNKKTSAACMMQVVSGERIKGRPLARDLIASPELCIKTGMKILAGALRNKRTNNWCDAIVGYNYGPKYIGHVSYNNRLMTRVREVHQKLWGEKLPCR